MVNILISGALGKMGRKVYQVSNLRPNVKAVCGVDITQDFSCKDFPVYDNFNSVKEKIDVVVDFSSPSNLESLLGFCLEHGYPAVLCTTGYTNSQIDKIKEASSKIAIFRSGNMSLGVNLLIDLVKRAYSTLNGFDVEIIEKHHNNKVDAPSGTALMLADAIKEIAPNKFYVYGRSGFCGKRNQNEIGIHAVRCGNVVGEHEIIFSGDFETVTLSHQATDRSVFAEGAVKACFFIATKPKGLYDMNDVINGNYYV